jgi:hypothetical protein
MAAPKIAMVVGNGLSMSFGKHTGLSEIWNSQSPLDWEIECPYSGGPFLQQLPLLQKLKKSFPNIADFEVFKKLQDPSVCNSLSIHAGNALIEARHYLTIAFSKLAYLQLQEFDNNWGWYKWMERHRENLSCVFSLNYDLLVENCLDRLGIYYTYYESQGNHYGIPVAKPHGSVNFEMKGIVAPTVYPIRAWCTMNDMPMFKIENKDLLKPRLEPLCITPNEANKYLDHQWVTPIKDSFLDRVKDCTHCIFIGISYFECDRPELDEIVKSIPMKSQIIVANPDPSPEFIETLHGRPVVYWKSYNSPLRDDTDKPMMLKDAKTGEILKQCFCGSGISYQYCHSL